MIFRSIKSVKEGALKPSNLKQRSVALVVSQDLVRARQKFVRALKDALAGVVDQDGLRNIESHLRTLKFNGAAGQQITLNLVVRKNILPLTFIGWPESKDEGVFEQTEKFRRLGASVVEDGLKNKCSKITLVAMGLELTSFDATAAFVEGALLTSYRFDKYKKRTQTEEVSAIDIVGSALSEEGRRFAEAGARATMRARDLINLTPIDCPPIRIVNEAKQVARANRLKITVFNKQKLLKMGANLHLAVSAGSDAAPYLVKLEYRPRKARKTISLVGKGVTFDSGGLSLKPGPSMETMKCDMSGAAAVLGAIEAAAILKLDVTVRAYLPLTENMINGRATRPGDVIRSRSGKTVEILNTDAEGRLILADALSVALEEKSDMIIDVATLTGACVVALGNDIAGLFSNDDKLFEQLSDAAAKAGERFWRMPLPAHYAELLKSPIADLKNIGGREAGAITAALFLKEFVDKTPWAHLDIAGPAFTSAKSTYIKRGGVGFGVRTLLRLIQGVA